MKNENFIDYCLFNCFISCAYKTVNESEIEVTKLYCECLDEKSKLMNNINNLIEAEIKEQEQIKLDTEQVRMICEGC